MNKPDPVVFVIDDDDAVRSSLRLLLRSAGLPAVTMAAADDFLKAYDPLQPGCALLDVRMPGMSGLELQQTLNRRGAMIPVIFMSGHGDVPMAVEAMQQGAFDFLQKPFSPDQLLSRIRQALDKDRRNRERAQNGELVRQRYEQLTDREREVLSLVADGRPNKIMAADLGISQRTVEIHRARVMEKMGAASLADLVRMCMLMQIAP